MRTLLTQAELQRHLHYDPLTGTFTRISGPRRGKTVKPRRYDDQYLSIYVSGRLYLAQRLAVLYMTGRSLTSDFYVDHINGTPSDNRWANLRAVTYAENTRNNARRTDNTSGVVGVTWNQRRQRWQAQIGRNSRNFVIGTYDTLEEAASHRKFAEWVLGFHTNHGRTV